MKDTRWRTWYVKPEALDLGAVAPIVGASCVVGTTVSATSCYPTGSSPGGKCSIGLYGQGSGQSCVSGNSPWCVAGNNAGLGRCSTGNNAA